MYGRVFAVAVIGVQGHLVTVEAHVGRGLPALSLSGLPGAGVLDGRERVRPAVESAGLEWPLRRVVVNLSPANVRKEGPGFDLPIAMGVLAASGQVPTGPLRSYALAGELSLKGELVATPGVLSVAMAAARANLAGVIVPRGNGTEAALVEGLDVIAAPDLAAVVAFVRGQARPDAPADATEVTERSRHGQVDLADVRGQATARRALEIAAAGGHNVLMVGPPGAGKTMLARRLPTILPAMSRREALEVTRLHSVAGLLRGGLVRERPFRAPHHSISAAALLGGGAGFLRPGEVSLAHHGVLFLDEATEFRRDAVEGLRQPLEDGRVLVARAAGTVEFPARFMLAAASNPCPCGFENDPKRQCTCPPHRALAYRQRLSGPLLDRMDLQLSIPRLTRSELLGSQMGEPSAVVRDRVQQARKRQEARLDGTPWSSNAQMPGAAARRLAKLTSKGERLLGDSVDDMVLTGRGFDRTIKVARTIADLDGQEQVSEHEIQEALNYRTLWLSANVAAAG